MKKRNICSYVEQEEVLNKPWLSTEDLLKIIPLGITAVNNFRKELCEEMEAKNEFYFKTKPILVPTKKVIKKLNIDVNYIRTEANKIKNIERRKK